MYFMRWRIVVTCICSPNIFYLGCPSCRILLTLIKSKYKMLVTSNWWKNQYFGWTFFFDQSQLFTNYSYHSCIEQNIYWPSFLRVSLIFGFLYNLETSSIPMIHVWNDFSSNAVKNNIYLCYVFVPPLKQLSYFK